MKMTTQDAKSVLLALIVALSLGMALTSCSDSSEERNLPPVAGNPTGKPVDTATVGSIAGIVKLDGTPPNRKPVFMGSAPFCAIQHSSPPLNEHVVVGDKGGLQNAVVYLRGDFSQYVFPRPSMPVHMDQKDCIFVPHVVAVMSGAPLQFLNSDKTTHNIHPVPKHNRGWNESQPLGGAPIERSFAREEVAIPIKCNLHRWMNGYVVVLDNPYFQVTGSDGSFDLGGIPPGTYQLTAWHELYGTSEQTVTINSHQAQSASIVFHASPQ